MSTSPGNRRWGIIVLLIIDYFVMFVARSGMSMCGPALMQEYGWSAMQFGWVSTAFFIGYAVTMLPAGLLADRFGGGVVFSYRDIMVGCFHVSDAVRIDTGHHDVAAYSGRDWPGIACPG